MNVTGRDDHPDRAAHLRAARDEILPAVCAAARITHETMLRGARTRARNDAWRLLVYSLFSAGFRVGEIAALLGRSHCTVSRDVSAAVEAGMRPIPYSTASDAAPVRAVAVYREGVRRTLEAALDALDAAIGRDAGAGGLDAARRRYDAAVRRLHDEPDSIAEKVWREHCRREYPSTWQAQSAVMPWPWAKHRRNMELSL